MSSIWDNVPRTRTNEYGATFTYRGHEVIDATPAPTIPADFKQPATRDGRPKYIMVNPFWNGSDDSAWYPVDVLGRRVEYAGTLIMNKDDGSWSPEAPRQWIFIDEDGKVHGLGRGVVRETS